MNVAPGQEEVPFCALSLLTMTSLRNSWAERVQVSTIWKQFLTQVLAYWRGKLVRLVLDCTPFDDRATMVYLGLLVQSRVLPIAWRIMPLQEEWEQGQWELVGELLDAVSLYLEPTDCTVIADRGLAGLPLVKLCRDRKFHYLLRGGLGAYLPQEDGRRLDVVVCLAAYRQSHRTAVVWAGSPLAGRDHRDLSECHVGPALSGSLVLDF